MVPSDFERSLFITESAFFPPRKGNGKPIVTKHNIFLPLQPLTDLRNEVITGDALKAQTGPAKISVSYLLMSGGLIILMFFDIGVNSPSALSGTMSASIFSDVHCDAILRATFNVCPVFECKMIPIFNCISPVVKEVVGLLLHR